MNTPTIAASALALLTMTGCIISVDGHDWNREYAGYSQIDRHEMDDLVSTNREARLGMDQATVLGLYPDHLTTLKGSMLDGTSEVEAWKVSAVTKNGDVSFTRWLYFYDGRLVELRDDRVDWDDEARLATWRTH